MNLASFPSQLAFQARDKVNSGGFLGFGRGEVKFQTITGQSMNDPNIGQYYAVTVEFAIRKDWKRRVLNQGFREKDGNELKRILVDGADTTVPVLLDEDGSKLAQGGTPVELEFEIYEEANFSAIFGI